MANLGDIQVELRAKVQNFLKGMEKSKMALSELSTSLRTLGNATGMATVALGTVGTASAVMASRFQLQMTKTAAVASGGAKGFDQAFGRMSNSALSLAGSTQYTANEVGGAMQFMAMAGLGVEKTMAGLPAVLQLAAASGVDLAESADTVTNIMSGMGVQSEELASVNNILIGTFTSSNVSLSELGQAFKMVGPVAKGVGVGLTDVSAAIGMMGNAGIKGTMAGTGMRKMLLSLFSSGKKAQKSMKALGITAKDISSENGGVENLIRKLEVAQQILGREQFTRLTTDVFGLRSLPKVGALVGQGSAAFAVLKEKIKKAQKENIAFFLEQKQLNTVAGQWNILVSAVEKVAIVFGQKLFPALKGIIDIFTNLFRAFGDLSSGTKETIVNVAMLATGILGAATAGLLFAASIAGVTFAIMGMKLGFAAISGVLAPLVVLLALAKMALVGVALYYGAKLGYAIASTNSQIKNGQGLWESIVDGAKYATESIFTLTETLKNFAYALANVGTLGTLGGRSAEDMDASYASSFYSGAEQKAMALAAEAAKLKKELGGLSKEFPNMIKIGDKLGGLLGQTGGRSFNVSQSAGAVGGANPQQIAKAVSANERLKEIDIERLKISNKIKKEKKRESDVAAAKAKAEEDAAKKRTKAMLKEMEIAQKESMSKIKTEDELKKEAQAREKARNAIKETSAGLSNKYDVLKAGDLGGLMTTVHQYIGTLDDLMTAHELLGLSSEANRQAFDDLEDVTRMGLIKQLSSMKGNQTAEEFAKTLKKANDMIAGTGLSERPIMADEVIVKSSKPIEFSSDMGGSIKKVFGSMFDKFGLGKKADSAYGAEGMGDILKGGAGDILSSGMGSMLAGSGVGSTLGAAVGTAVAGPAGVAAGQIIGGAVEQVIMQIPAMISGMAKAIPDFLTSIIPEGMDSRLATAINSDVVNGLITSGIIAALIAIAAAFVAVTGGLNIFTAAILIVAAAFAAIVPALSVFAGVISLGAQGFTNSQVMNQNGEIVAAPERDALSRLFDAFAVSLDKVVLAMQPFFQSLFPLAGLFDMVVQLLIPFANALSGTASMGEAAFNALKNFALMTGHVALFIANSWEMVMGALRRIPESVAKGFHNMFSILLNVVNPFVGALGLAITALGGIARFVGEWIGDSDMQDTGRDMQNLGVDMVLMNSNIIDALSDIYAATTSLDIDRDALRNTISEIDGMTYEAGMGIFNGLDSIGSSIGGIGEELTNVPSGFKVSLNRWRAILGEEGGLTVGGSVTGTSNNTINSLSQDSYFAKMQNAVYLGVCEALKNCCNCGGGFKMADIGNMLQNLGIGTGPIGVAGGGTTVHIGTLNAANGQEFVDEVQKAIELRNYQSSGNQFSKFGSGGTWRS